MASAGGVIFMLHDTTETTYQRETPDPPVAAPPAPSAGLHSAGLIEIELPGGYRVRIGSNIKAAALRVVLDALERR